MARAFREGAFEFSINPLEAEYEPPHVHVWFANSDEDARINLISSTWLEPPPPDATKAMRIFKRRRAEIVALWNKFHANRLVQDAN